MEARPLTAADLTTMPMHTQIPVPEAWLNLAALLPSPLPIAQTGDGQTVSFDGLAKIYSEECARIELLGGPYGADAWIPIPEEVARNTPNTGPLPFTGRAGSRKLSVMRARFTASAKISRPREATSPTPPFRRRTMPASKVWPNSSPIPGRAVGLRVGMELPQSGCPLHRIHDAQQL